MLRSRPWALRKVACLGMGPAEMDPKLPDLGDVANDHLEGRDVTGTVEHDAGHHHLQEGSKSGGRVHPDLYISGARGWA